MKKLSKLKLNQISNNQLSSPQMKSIKGGGWTCGCGCHYSTAGGSSTEDNCMANMNGGGLGSGGGNIVNCGN